ncbi:MAG: riboflavin synthase [Longimicrobiales bacterium]
MFTGLVEAVGRVAHINEGEEGRTFHITAPFLSELELGQSVAIDGACLTVTSIGASSFAVTAVAATLQRTVAGSYEPGTAVNLERAITVGDRLDGHLVQGHVDGLAEYLGAESGEGGRILRFQLPPSVATVTIPQGSVTLSGISLTVSRISPQGICEVAIIPHTWDHTNLSGLQSGAGVNVEGDVIGKYVAKLVARSGNAGREAPFDEGLNGP